MDIIRNMPLGYTYQNYSSGSGIQNIEASINANDNIELNLFNNDGQTQIVIPLNSEVLQSLDNSLIPSTNDSITLGDENKKFSDVYCVNLHADNNNVPFDNLIPIEDQNNNTIGLSNKKYKSLFVKNFEIDEDEYNNEIIVGKDNNGEVMRLKPWTQYGLDLGDNETDQQIGSIYCNEILSEYLSVSHDITAFDFMKTPTIAVDKLISYIPSTTSIKCERHFLPNLANTYNLGTDNIPWNNLYINTINASAMNIASLNNGGNGITIEDNLLFNNTRNIGDPTNKPNTIYASTMSPDNLVTSYASLGEGGLLTFADVIGENQMIINTDLVPGANNVYNLGGGTVNFNEIRSQYLFTSPTGVNIYVPAPNTGAFTVRRSDVTAFHSFFMHLGNDSLEFSRYNEANGLGRFLEVKKFDNNTNDLNLEGRIVTIRDKTLNNRMSFGPTVNTSEKDLQVNGTITSTGLLTANTINSGEITTTNIIASGTLTGVTNITASGSLTLGGTLSGVTDITVSGDILGVTNITASTAINGASLNASSSVTTPLVTVNDINTTSQYMSLKNTGTEVLRIWSDKIECYKNIVPNVGSIVLGEIDNWFSGAYIAGIFTNLLTSGPGTDLIFRYGNSSDRMRFTSSHIELQSGIMPNNNNRTIGGYIDGATTRAMGMIYVNRISSGKESNVISNLRLDRQAVQYLELNSTDVRTFYPIIPETELNLGSSSNKFNDLYLAGDINLSANSNVKLGAGGVVKTYTVDTPGDSHLLLARNGQTRLALTSFVRPYVSVVPNNADCDLGSIAGGGHRFKNLYLSDDIHTNGVYRMPSGTALLPSIVANNRTGGALDSGIWSKSNGMFNISVFGIEKFELGSGGCYMQTWLKTKGDVFPDADDQYNLGLPGTTGRWNDIYATNNVIQTSDQNQKQNISNSDLGINFINELTPRKYQFINGNSARYHYGLISQEVKTVLDNNSIPTSQFAGYIYTPPQDIVDTHGNVTGQSDESFGLRYNEFIAPMIKAIQELSTTVQELSTTVNNLISRIETLEAELQ